MHWNDDAEVPIYESGRKSRYTPTEATKIVFEGKFQNATCQRHPLRVRQNASFLVSTCSYKDWEDIKDDMNGAYTKALRCAIWTVECEKLSGGLHISVVEKKALKLSGENQYHQIGRAHV